jgi:hypothetical protein
MRSAKIDLTIVGRTLAITRFTRFRKDTASPARPSPSFPIRPTHSLSMILCLGFRERFPRSSDSARTMPGFRRDCSFQVQDCRP